MSTDDDQEQPAPLPQADGPLVDVALPDGQHLYAVVKSRLRETDRSWWYRLQIHLPSGAQVRGRLVDEPAPIDFLAPASRCQPIDGQPYDRVPTERAGVTPAWKAEVSERLAAVAETGTDPDAVTSTYQAVQELINKAVESDPQLRIGEQRARFQSALKATRKNIAVIDPANLPEVVDDDLRTEITALQELINALVASISQR
ncbi:hypothetical protein SAMN05216223_11648 [Actinacidiphila yanglinensis]|uniref:Uncharacterized protein n=1 Tax=Actinacidiphila yanglinensis TaxID=310779 RepID=A0A1H6DJB1_9ACTN|nr:hypothetical protein [Actinacidiphila yanglinensis]SEG85360.1 hypothetical protein SAMN05216223_11648 [Actinacidiphila yanglinensis]